jgi:Gpi18-like mannosyltransferase
MDPKEQVKDAGEYMNTLNRKSIRKMKLLNNPVIATFKKLFNGFDWKGIGTVLIAYIVTRAIVIVVLYFSMAVIPIEKTDEAWRYNPRNLIADGLIRADSGSYIFIADHGYTDPTDGSISLDSHFYIPIPDEYNKRLVAFFPLYPLLIRLTASITGNIVTSGLWVSNISFLIALFYLYALTKQEFDDETAGRAVFFLAAAPSAFFFSAVYTEGTFLMFMAAGFYYSRNKNWFLAGLAGALASATRPQGVLVAIFIFLEALWQQGIRFVPRPWSIRAQIDIIKKDIRELPKAWIGILASILSTSGLLAYMVYLYYKFGDPFWFLRVQVEWGRKVGFDWLPTLIQKVINIGEIFEISLLMDTLFTIAFIPLVIIVLLKFRPSFGLFTLFSFLFPLTSASTLSMQRFVLVLIPCYFLLALWGKRPWVERVIIGISMALQAFFLVLFSHWYWAG